MTLAGWTGFDGHIDYRINLKGLTDRLPDKARRLLGDLNVDLGSLTIVDPARHRQPDGRSVNGVSLDRGLLREIRTQTGGPREAARSGRQFLDQLVR